jgi:hypothetical protein
MMTTSGCSNCGGVMMESTIVEPATEVPADGQTVTPPTPDDT